MKLAGKTILITGATGFVGLRAAELAFQQGMKVRGLVRSPQKATVLQALGVEIITGDITDPKAAAIACQDVDIVLHTAAIVEVDGNPEAFQSVNVNGVLTMAQAAQVSGVDCFVHLSSVMVYGFTFPDQVTETDPLRGEGNPYCQTKIDSEKVLLQLQRMPQLARQGNTDSVSSTSGAKDMGVIIIRPGDIYGPRGTAWITGPLQRMRQKELILPCWGKGCINHVYIDNLLDGIFLAIEQEAYGEIFNLTDGQATSSKEFFSRLAKIDRLSPPLAVPTPVLRFLFQLYLIGQKLKGKKPELYADSINWLCRPHAYSIEKARHQLGYDPKITLAEGMSRTQEWLQHKKL
jgi:nucleoside-diphosphate-sugar epimerase